MSLRFITALVLSFVCLTSSAWAENEAGLDAYERGDYATAVKEWRALAEQGDVIAQFDLGLMYQLGEGVQQDFVKARWLYEQAAAKGHSRAQRHLGSLFATGQGVPQDYHKALFWYRRAADQKDATAQVQIGIMYEEGNGVPQDYVQAHMWYNLATANGKKIALTFRDELAKTMTGSQIAEAQKLAREWKPRGK